MSPATWPRGDVRSERLLAIDPVREIWRDHRVGDLPSLLRRGDLVVVNDAATLPGSLAGRAESGAEIELRLAAREPDGTFRAVMFGAGDWHTPTEHRPSPPPMHVGDRLHLGDDLDATVVEISPMSQRHVRVRFSLEDTLLWPTLYRRGTPVQYSYVRAPLALWHVQTTYASRPWAAEMPSAGRPLTWEAILAMRARGVRFTSLTHAAGLSSTGDAALDAALPTPERFDIPAETADAIVATRAAGGRVIAVGTTVVRALEGCAVLHGGALVAGEGITDLRIGRDTPLRWVDGLLTGMHEPTASHFALMRAFVSPTLLERATAHATSAGYLCHEFGDSTLVLADA